MPIKHEWNGTILTITSDSGTSSADLKGAKGDTGARGVRGLTGATGGGATIEDNVISEETTWSSSRIMDNFAESMSVSGNPVSCMPIPNYPLHIITTIEPNTTGISEINVTRCGKNMASNYYIDETNTAAYNPVLFIDDAIKPNTTYTLSFVGAAGNKYYPNEYLFESQPAITADGTRQSITLTTLADLDINSSQQYRSGYGWIIFKNNIEQANNNVFTDIQLELGSTATAYEAYNGNTYTMLLPENIYGGSIDWTTGIVSVDYDANGLLAEPYTIEAEPQTINAIEGINTLFTDADNIQVIGRVDTMYQLSQLAERIAALEAAIINA